MLSPILYRLCDKRREFVLHHDRLKVCRDADMALWLVRRRRLLMEEAEEAAQENEGMQQEGDELN